MGYGGAVTLIGDEPGLPYQRPPLSKAYLLGKMDATALSLRAESFFERQAIAVRHGCRVTDIERDARHVRLSDGSTLPYEHLVLATGTRNRVLPVPGNDLADVLSLRSLADAAALKAAMTGKSDAVVIGAGFIGMEFAAVASGLGLAATVVEAGPRVMARATSPQIGHWFEARHRARGVTFLFDTGVTGIEGRDGVATGVILSDGRHVPAELVLVAVGVVANVELAQAAGLAVDNGIVVDEHLLTADPHISAIGDCATSPSVHAPGLLRLESVQNAVDQAKSVAARLAGRPAPYINVPWFWSDQGPDKLQIAGLVGDATERLPIGAPDSGRFSVLAFRDGRFVGAESVNRPTDHMAVRRLLAAGTRLSPDQAAAADFDLATLVSASRAAA